MESMSVHRLLLLTLIVLAARAGAPQSAAAAQEAAPVIRAFRGVVLDPSGAALPRVLVRIRRSDGREAAALLTNARGEFSGELPEGSYTLEARLAGFAPLADYRLEVSASTPPVTLTLELPHIRDQIVVTATRSEAPLTQIGGSVTVLARSYWDAQAQAAVADGLRRVAGITVMQNGAPGQVATLFVRGGNSDYTKVLLDGIPLNDPGGAYNFADLAASGIERVEIVRGPQSALFGSDAMAGTVQIFTRRGTSEGLNPKPALALEGGSYSSTRFAAGLEGSSRRLDYMASFSRMDTDNNVPNGSFHNATASVNAGFRPFAGSELRAVVRSEAGRAGVPGPWAFIPPDADEYYRHRNLAGGLAFSQQVSTSWSQKVSYTVYDARRFSENPSDSGPFVASYQGRVSPFPYTAYAYQFLNATRRQTLEYQNTLILPGGHLFTAGAAYEHESGTIGDPRARPARARRNNYAVYFQDEAALGSRVFAAGGVRLEQNDSFGFAAAPRASLAVHLHRPAPQEFWGLTKIRASCGQGIKEPSLMQSFSSSPYFPGNPNLLPERAVSCDAGLEQHFGRQAGMLELTWFSSRYRDQIGFAVTDYTTFSGTFFNVGRSMARGAEVLVRAAPARRWEFDAGYTYLETKVLAAVSPDDPAYAAGRQLMRRPRHSGYADLRWKPGRWTLEAGGIFVGKRADVEYFMLNVPHNPGYGIVNLLARFRLAESASLFIAVRNVADRRYMEVLGYPALGRNWRAGLRLGM